MVNPLCHWIRIPFGTRLRISLRGFSSFQGIEFRIPLRGLSGFRVTTGLVVTEILSLELILLSRRIEKYGPTPEEEDKEQHLTAQGGGGW